MKSWSYLTLLLLPTLAYAESAPLTTGHFSSEFNRLQRQNKQQLDQLQHRQLERWLSSHQYQNEQNVQTAEAVMAACLPYSSIVFEGFTLINPEKFAPKRGECLNEQRLNQLSKEITAGYLAKGYVYNPFRFEDDQQGHLVMRVQEGKISKMSRSSKRLNFATLLPHRLGKPLSIRDLDQMLDQANKMAGSEVSVDVFPRENGDVELVVVNKEKAPLNVSLSVDNQASKSFERWQMKSALSVDSPFGLSDTLYLGFNHTLKTKHNHFNRAVALSYGVPYGYWSFNAFGSFSQFRMITPLQYSSVLQRGRTWQAGLRADYTFHRGSNHISSVSMQFEHQASKNYVQDALIELQSPRLTTAQLSISHLQLFERGSLVAELGYERGLRWFNALHHQGNEQPEGQFDKYSAELQWQAYPRLADFQLHQTHRLSGQYSRNYLPAAKQTDLLSRYAVRGFNSLSTSAEKSLILQNNLGWIVSQDDTLLEPYLLFDFGIQKTATGDTHHQQALGYGIGLKISRQQLSANLEWATGRLFSLNASVEQERAILFNLMWQF